MKVKRTTQGSALKMLSLIQFSLISSESKTVVWSMEFLNSNKVVICSGLLNSIHMFMEIVIDVFVTIACQKCLQKEFMIIFFRYVLDSLLLKKLYWLFFLFGLYPLPVSIKIQFAKMFFIETWFFMFDLKWRILFFLFDTVSTILKDMFFQFFIFHLISILFTVLSQKSSKDIRFNLIFVFMSQEIPIINLLMITIKIDEKQREQLVISKQSFHYFILSLQILNC